MNPNDENQTPNQTPNSSTPVTRRKIKIQRIEDNRSRQATFLKRKNGLFKKAMELGVLCDCEIGVIVYNVHNGKLFEYSSVDMEHVLNRYASYSGPSERRKRENFFDLSAAKGYSNIPQNEPNMAQAARNAAIAASSRPRPTYKFEEETNTQPQGSNRKLSYGETSVAPTGDFEPHPISEVNTGEMPPKRLKLGNGQHCVANPTEAPQAFEQVQPQQEANSVFHAAPSMNHSDTQGFESGVQLNQPAHISPAASTIPQTQLTTATLNSRKRSFAETVPVPPQALGPSFIMRNASGSGWQGQGFEGNPDFSLQRSATNGLFQRDPFDYARDGVQPNQTGAHFQPSNFEIAFNCSNGLQVTTNAGAPEETHAPSHSQLPYGWIEQQHGHSGIPPHIRDPNGMTATHAPEPSEVNRVLGDGKEEDVIQPEDISPASAEEGSPARRLHSVQAPHTTSDTQAPNNPLVSGITQDEIGNNQNAEQGVVLLVQGADGSQDEPRAGNAVAHGPSEDEVNDGSQVPSSNEPQDVTTGSEQEAGAGNLESAPPPADGGVEESAEQNEIPAVSETPGNIPALNLTGSPQEQAPWMTLSSLASGELESGVSLFGADHFSARRTGENPFALPSSSSAGFDTPTPRFFDPNPGEDL